MLVLSMTAQMNMVPTYNTQPPAGCRSYKAHCSNNHERPYNNPLAEGEGIVCPMFYSHSQSLAIGPTLGFIVVVSYSKRPNSMPSFPQ